MREAVQQYRRQAVAEKPPLLGGISTVSRTVRRAAEDTLSFVFQPIAFEFRRMEEEAGDCMSQISRAALTTQEKQRLQEQISHLLGWIGMEKWKHYNDFSHSRPVIDIRHEFVEKLQGVREAMAQAA